MDGGRDGRMEGGREGRTEGGREGGRTLELDVVDYLGDQARREGFLLLHLFLLGATCHRD